jgi:hypothetical protein
VLVVVVVRRDEQLANGLPSRSATCEFVGNGTHVEGTVSSWCIDGNGALAIDLEGELGSA